MGVVPDLLRVHRVVPGCPEAARAAPASSCRPRILGCRAERATSPLFWVRVGPEPHRRHCRRRAARTRDVSFTLSVADPHGAGWRYMTLPGATEAELMMWDISGAIASLESSGAGRPAGIKFTENGQRHTGHT